jgi:AcrR family transcriptional regulator
MSNLDPLAAARSLDRPRAHEGTSETEVAIFEATEALLGDVPLHDLSVAQIIAAAGVSRATFYFYFSSKYAVVSGLLAQITDEVFQVITPFTQRDEEVAPEEALRESLAAAIDLWAGHRPAMRAVHEHWNTTDELRTLWVGIMERFTEAVAAEIDRERSAGLAVPGPDSRQLAAALLWSTECCLYVAGVGADAHLPDESSLLAPLLSIWRGALYSGTGTS